MKKEIFMVYEMVRISGITNMFDVKKVEQISNSFGHPIRKEDILDCMKNYNIYANQFLDINTVNLIRAEVKDKMSELGLEPDDDVSKDKPENLQHFNN